MLKNVSLLAEGKNGRQTWKLLGPTGVPNEPFSTFANSIARRMSRNSVATYCRHLAQFFDYLYEASSSVHIFTDSHLLTPDALVEIIEAYSEYLVFGADSGNEIARIVSNTMPSPRNTSQTCSLKHAPVRKFLKLSDKIHRQTIELVNAGLIQENPSAQLMIDLRRLQDSPSQSQRKALVGNSMLAGVIAGGVKLLPSALLPVVNSQVSFDESRAFPYDMIEGFIDKLPSHRDKALYNLLAASGCRKHEALQVLWDDISVEGQEVFLIDPASRPNCKSYLYLTPNERTKLCWKGRTTQRTLLLEPFASGFFKSLADYLKHEYIPHGLHRFVFQYRRSPLRGRPFFLSHPETHLELFKKVAEKCDIGLNVHGPHSLRHAFGTYLLNYFPRTDGGFGLNIGIVQQIMGHAELKSTEKYARHDQDIILAELKYANAMVYGRGSTKSMMQMKLDVLNAQIRKIEADIKNEKLSRPTLR
jgi:integrase